MRNGLRGNEAVVWLVVALALAGAGSAGGTVQGRSIVVVSDLHFGPGRVAGEWKPVEDFRWGGELEGFLAAVRAWGKDRVDLVVAGDLLELWQHPDVACLPPDEDADFGCSAAEIDAVTAVVVREHREDLKALGDFATAGDNRLHVVPGNHDAGLLLDGVWNRVAAALGASAARALRVASGRWVSADGLVAVEHGQQIGKDVNRFPDWPSVSALHLGEERLVRSWGEQFVQQLYNDVEAEYPLIDNLQPVSAGTKYYRRADAGPTLPRDAARFLLFNLFDTSLAQKVSLGPEGARAGEPPQWDVLQARSRGYDVVLDALEDGDPQRAQLLAPGAPGDGLRAETSRLVADAEALPEEELLALCDRISALAKASAQGDRQLCGQQLAAAGLSRVIPERRVLRRYLQALKSAHPKVRLFVYGHTHELRRPWQLALPTGEITIVNTGAFQRLLDERTLLSEAERQGTEPQEVFRSWKLEQLPACYSAVLVAYENELPVAELRHWFVDAATGAGELVSACDARCGYRNRKECGD